MLRLTAFSTFLLTMMVLVKAIPQKRNYKDIWLTDININKLGNLMDKSSSFELKPMKGGGSKAVGVLKVNKDFPTTTTFQWKAYYVNDDNQMVKQAEGKRSTLCDFMVKEKPMADMMLGNSNLTSCMVKQGTYGFRKCVPNKDVIPPKLPENKNQYKIQMIAQDKQELILSMTANVIIVRE